MRNRVLVVGRDVAMRARLAALVSQAGCRAEVAESLAHARRLARSGIALAIVDPEGLAADSGAVARELRETVDEVLIVARPGQVFAPPDAVDAADETRLLARIAKATRFRSEPETEGRILEFAGYFLDLAAHSLTHREGREVSLTSGEFKLLAALAERAGRVLSRDQLLQLVAGREAETYDRSVDMQVVRLRRKIEPDPNRPSLIVTVPGGGYRFAPIVRVLKPTAEAAIAPISRAPAASRPRLSIAVLPFANMSSGSDEDYFADGVTESLTTDLSRMRGAFIIAPSTAFAYRQRPIDVRTLGHELNVRYVLDGSVQRSDGRMRVGVKLVDAETCACLWAERFDKPVIEFFALQDEIVSHLARQLDTALIAVEARRASQSPEQDALDLYFQGMAWVHRGYARDNLAKADEYFERALTLDPQHVDALVGRAWVEMTLAGGYTTEDRVERLERARAALRGALALAPDHAMARLCLGRVEISSRRPAAAIAECERALSLDGNLAAAHATIGLAKIFMGRGDETVAHVQDALRLSPRDPFAMSWTATAGLSKLYTGRDEEAVEWFRRSIGLFHAAPNAHFYLAAALALLGRAEEARIAVATGLMVNPAFSILRFRDSSFGDEPRFLQQRERVYDGLRKAGAPEG